ncbi:MAG TPA: GNAT family N-acetyltransferase [Frankiaceae bacterium]|nr:GNAT family N-acetyltransferase [Frankiaceae bacterium]
MTALVAEVAPPRAVVLRDGSLGVIRELVAEDRDALLVLHESLSPRTLYLRFFSASKLSAGRYVTRLVRPGTGDHGAVVMEVQGRLVGVAAYECVEEDLTPVAAEGLAEAAFVVADDQHGRGIGTLLMEHLAALARRRSIHQFVAETLPDNAAMLDVFKEAGYAVTFRRSLDTVQVSIDLTPGPNVLTALDQRERAATCANLMPLLRPRSVAIAGASSRPRSVGGAVLNNLLLAEFGGEIYPIVPAGAGARARTMRGLATYSRLADVPGPVDLLVLAVPAKESLAVVDDCLAAQVKAMVVLSSGFSDAGPEGAALEAELLATARHAGVRVVGPNCLGVTSTAPGVHLAATYAPHLPLPGRVGVLTQSGGLGIALLEHTRRAGIGLSSFVSVGNKADVSGNDLLSWWDDDPATDIAVLYLESFGNPRKFARLARHVAAHKPVVAIKAGRTAVGARAARSRTAAAAEPTRSVAALFRQAGVINVDHVGELVDVVTLLSTQPLPAGPGIAIVGNTGGPGILAADAAAEFGLAIPMLSEQVQARLREVLAAGAAVANPVDTHTTATGEQFREAIAAVLRDPAVDSLLAIITPTPHTSRAELTQALCDAAETTTKPVLVTEVGSDAISGVLAGGSRGIPAYAFPETAIRAVSRACEYRSFRDRPTGSVPEFPDLRPADAAAVISDALLESPEGGWLDPAEVEGLLAAYGVQCLPSRLVTSARAAGKAALELGMPVALKAVGPELVRKSDIGGVRLGLRSEGAVRKAFSVMQEAVGKQMYGALIQPMAPAGVETLVGVTADPSFGPLVTFGLGGLWSDLMADQAFRLVPLTDVDAQELISSVRMAPLLDGYRGSPPCDVDALVQLLLRVGKLADNHPELVALTLNPVVALPRGLAVLDAKARIAPREAERDVYSRQLR